MSKANLAPIRRSRPPSNGFVFKKVNKTILYNQYAYLYGLLDISKYNFIHNQLKE